MELKSFPGAESVRDITFNSTDGTTVYEVATFPNPAHEKKEITTIWKIGEGEESMPKEDIGWNLGREEGRRSDMRYIARVEYYNWNTFSVRVDNQPVALGNQTGGRER